MGKFLFKVDFGNIFKKYPNASFFPDIQRNHLLGGTRRSQLPNIRGSRLPTVRERI